MSSDPDSIRFRSVDGIELHVLHWKPDPSPPSSTRDRDDVPVVLLHGGGANAHWWDHLAPRIANRRDVYALDFRGHGDSDHPTERFVGAFNVDLESLLAWLGRSDAILVGHSMGAAVALDHASRVSATRGIGLVDLARGGNRGGGRRARLALSLRRTYRTRAEAVERFRFLPESSHATEELRLSIAGNSVRCEPDGRYGYKFDPGWFGLPPRPRPDLRGVGCPVLLVRGGESNLLSREAARAFVAELVDGQLIEIPHAGHHVLLDRPDELTAALAGFLDRIDSTRGAPEKT